MNRRFAGLVCGSIAAPAALYGAYVGATWLRYGRPRAPKAAETDPLLDRFMPQYEVVERHNSFVRAPAEIVLRAACEVDFEDSPIIRAVFRARELLLGAQPGEPSLPRGVLAKTQALGWRILSEVPGREIVMGAVTQPWEPNPVFHGLKSDEFASFRDPDYVKIAWTLRADPVTAETSIFRTETRVLACGPASRAKFRKYWALLSPGIRLIRLGLLRSLRQEAERKSTPILVERTAY